MVINHAQKCNPRPANHELETISRSDGSCYLKGSSSMQPNPAPQKQVHVQEMHQQSSSMYNELSSAVSLDDAPREEEQVSGVGNEVLSVPLVDNSTLEGSNSQQGCSSDYKTMLDGNAQPHVNFDPNFWDRTNFIEDTAWEGSCNAFEQSGGCTPASEAGSCGSLMGYSRSPVRAARGTRCRRFSSSPARGATSSNYWARPAPPLWGDDLFEAIRGADLAPPQICQDNLSNAGTYFTDEEFLNFTDEEFLKSWMR
ncbi:hypothetical protein U9M48_038877 [Paspalum notatum var. saurae]|uniref:Uncharacterized protein n=1 Tax=Paspalum notatum var. saurae TaxID=547442 RepID=A0AAQ3UJG6_PASNO